MDNKEAILASIPEEHKEEGAKLYTSLLEEKVIKKMLRVQNVVHGTNMNLFFTCI